MSKALNRVKLDHAPGSLLCLSLPVVPVFMGKKPSSMGETGVGVRSCTMVWEQDPLAPVVESTGIYCEPSQVPKN